MHLVGFTIRIYHDARSPERQNIVYSEKFLIMDRGTVPNV